MIKKEFGGQDRAWWSSKHSSFLLLMLFFGSADLLKRSAFVFLILLRHIKMLRVNIDKSSVFFNLDMPVDECDKNYSGGGFIRTT